MNTARIVPPVDDGGAVDDTHNSAEEERSPAVSLHGRRGTVRELIAILKQEDRAMSVVDSRGGAPHAAYGFGVASDSSDGPPLVPLVEVLDAGHRAIRALQLGVVNPAIPPPMRDQGLALLQGAVGLVRRTLQKRLLLLAGFFMDPTFNLQTVARDISAACETPALYCSVDLTVRRRIRRALDAPTTAQTRADQTLLQLPDGAQTLTSNLCTLALAVAPFDAAWLFLSGCSCGADAPAADDEKALLRQLAQCGHLSGVSVPFAVPPSEPVEAQGMVMATGPGEDAAARRARRWGGVHRSPQDIGDLDADETPGASPTAVGAPLPEQPPAAGTSSRPTALAFPPIPDCAPRAARVGTAPIVCETLTQASRTGGVALSTRTLQHLGQQANGSAGDAALSEDASRWQAFRSQLRTDQNDGTQQQPPSRFIATSQRARAVRDLMLRLNERLPGDDAEMQQSVESPESGSGRASKQHRSEQNNGLVKPPAARRPPRYPPIGRGIPRLPDDVHRLVLDWFTPRSLRCVKAVNRRLALIVCSSPRHNALTQLAFDFSRRVAWYLEDEWGERVTSLATLPPAPVQPDPAAATAAA